MTNTARSVARRPLHFFRSLYPVLFAVFPVLALAASNAGDYSVGDVLTIAGVFAAGALLGFTVFFVLLRGRADLAALATLMGVALFYLYPAFLSRVARWWRPLASSEILLPLALALGVVFIILLVRRGARLERVSAFLALMGALLVGWSTARLAVNEWRGSWMARASGLAREFAQPVPLRPPAGMGTPKRPDIYLIILDAYPNAEVLRDYYGFDNSSFEDSLRVLGFTIPGSVRSNYAHTFLSLASMLNMGHVTQLADELGPESTDRWLPGHLIENNRAVRFLRSQGYRFVFFPSGWWAPTLRSRHADVQFQIRTGLSIQRELQRTDLRRQLVQHTLLRFIRKRVADTERVDPEHITSSFAALDDYLSQNAPTFVLAHFMLPHHPYVLDAGCRGIPVVQGFHVPRGSPHDKELFLNQVRCANRLVLDAVPRLMAASRTPPVILLQADHGTVTQWPWDHPGQAPKVTEVKERFGAFGAYLLPAGGEAALPDTVSAVNLLRYVFSHYLGADLPALTDSMYFSYPRHLYDFYPVDPQFHVGMRRAAP